MSQRWGKNASSAGGWSPHLPVTLTPKFLSSWIDDVRRTVNPTQKSGKKSLLPKDYSSVSHSFHPFLESERIRALMDENANYSHYLE